MTIKVGIHINDVAGNAETLGHLLEFDSVQGRWHQEVSVENTDIVIQGQRITTSQNLFSESIP
jgi:glyceraldehyde 3-phosphate dehydrogenase